MKNFIDIIEDDASLHDSIKNILSSAGYHTRNWFSAEEFLSSISANTIEFVLTDMRLPRKTGLELQAALSDCKINPVIIFMSGASSLEQCISAMKAGAFEFLLKPFGKQELLAAIAAGHAEVLSRQKRRATLEFQQSLMGRLTPREQQVLCLMLKGFANSEIQNELALALPTIKQYKMQILKKFEINTLAELMRLFPHHDNEFIKNFT